MTSCAVLNIWVHLAGKRRTFADHNYRDIVCQRNQKPTGGSRLSRDDPVSDTERTIVDAYPRPSCIIQLNLEGVDPFGPKHDSRKQLTGSWNRYSATTPAAIRAQDSDGCVRGRGLDR